MANTKNTETTDKVISPTIAPILTAKLRELGTNPLRLSKKIDYSYDYTRKVCKGEAFPGMKPLKLICKELGLDFSALWEMVKTDQAVLKFGDSLMETDEILTEIKIYWDALSEKSRKEVLDLVRAKADKAKN